MQCNADKPIFRCVCLFSEWPDLTESDSDDSAVEAIVGDNQSTSQGSGAQSKANPAPSTPPPPPYPATSSSSTQSNIPDENTAQRIMHLLTELGSSNLVQSPSFAERNFLHCPNCTGRLLNL